MKQKGERVILRLERLQKNICISLLAIMSAIVVVQVFSRYLFNHSFVWAEELVRYLLIWMVMIGSAMVQSQNNHIRIDFFQLRAGHRTKLIMETFFRLGILLFLAIIVYVGFEMAYFNRRFESSGLRISMFWATLAIPVGGILMGFYTIQAMLRDIYRLFCWPVQKLNEADKRLATENYDTRKET